MSTKIDAPADDIALPADQLPLIASTSPERIWLDVGEEAATHHTETRFRDLHEVTWSEDNASGYGIEYVRANRASPSRAAVPATVYVEVRECSECQHVDINGNSDTAACNRCDWSGPSPKEDHCPGCGEDGTMTSACTECGARSHLLASDSLPVAAPPVPAAVDVAAAQAETAQAAPTDVVAWQVRRAPWKSGLKAVWETCTQDLYDATLATGRYAGFENGPPCEVRALALAATPGATLPAEGSR